MFDVKIDDKEVYEIIERPDEYPEELVAVALGVVIDMERQIREAKVKVTHYLRKKMKEDNATKMIIKGMDGKEKIVTLKKSTPKCQNKNADFIYKESGFDPVEIGKNVFKPEWSKAKEARKMGGAKQKIIDSLFIEDLERIEIKDV